MLPTDAKPEMGLFIFNCVKSNMCAVMPDELVAANFSLRDVSWQNEQQIYCNVIHRVQKQMSESDVNNNFNIMFKFGGKKQRLQGLC